MPPAPAAPYEEAPAAKPREEVAPPQPKENAAPTPKDATKKPADDAAKKAAAEKKAADAAAKKKAADEAAAAKAAGRKRTSPDVVVRNKVGTEAFAKMTADEFLAAWMKIRDTADASRKAALETATHRAADKPTSEKRTVFRQFDTSVVRRLSQATETDFVFWGEVGQDQSSIVLKLTLFNSRGDLVATHKVGQSLPPNEDPIDVRQLVGIAITHIAKKTASKTAKGSAADRVFLQLSGKSIPNSKKHGNAESTNPEADQLLTTGKRYYEQAIAARLNRPKQRDLTFAAQAEFEKSIDLAPNNPLPNLHLADCLQLLGETEKAKKQFELAHSKVSSPKFRGDVTRLSVQADYALFVETNYSSAIEKYTELANRDASSLRARSAFSQLYLGAFDATGNEGKTFFDVNKAQFHLLEILARWPDSAIAESYHTSLLVASAPTPPDPNGFRAPADPPPLASPPAHVPQEILYGPVGYPQFLGR